MLCKPIFTILPMNYCKFSHKSDSSLSQTQLLTERFCSLGIYSFLSIPYPVFNINCSILASYFVNSNCFWVYRAQIYRIYPQKLHFLGINTAIASLIPKSLHYIEFWTFIDILSLNLGVYTFRLLLYTQFRRYIHISLIQDYHSNLLLLSNSL